MQNIVRPYILLFVSLFLFFGNTEAQPFVLSGEVVDEENQEKLPGVVVYTTDKLHYSSTDANGRFQLKDLPDSLLHLHFQMLGYEPFHIEIDLKRDTFLQVKLHPTAIELDHFVLEEGLLKGSAQKSSLSTDIVNEEFFRQQAGNTFSQALEKMPGISSLSVGVGISKPVIRGMSSNRVLVTENGIKQEGQQWGSDHGLELDQFNVERLEIIKGPASLLYGGEAIAGVIQILPPPIPEKEKLKAEAAAIYKSNNDLWGGSAMVAQNKNNNIYRVRATWLEYGDYKVPADSFTYNTYRLPLIDQRLKNTAGRERNLAISGGAVRKKGSFRFTFSAFQQKAGLFPGAMGKPRAYNLQADGDIRNIDLPRQENEHYKLLFNLSRKQGKNYWEQDLGFQLNRRKERAVPHLHGYGINEFGDLALSLDLPSLIYHFRYFHHYSPRLKSTYGASVSLLKNQISGFEFLIPNYISQTYALYDHLQFFISDRFTLSGGARIEINHLSMDAFSLPIYNSQLDIIGSDLRSPGLKKIFGNLAAAAGFSWEPEHEWNVKFNVGRTFRNPNPAELGANGVHHGTFRHEMGSIDLDPEIGYQSDLTVQYHNKRGLYRLTPFFNYFTNYLYLRPSANFSTLPDAGQVFEYSQAEAIFFGGEFLAEYHPLREIHIQSGIDAVFNYNLSTSLPLPFTPPPSLKLEFEYEKNIKNWDFNTGIDLRFFTSQKRIDRNEDPTNGYHLIHAFASGSVQLNDNSELHFQLRINNLTNEYYLNHLSRYRILQLPEQGRNLTFSIRYAWN